MRKGWFYTLQWRLLALVIALAACYGLGILYIRHWHRVQVATALQQQVHQKKEFFERLVELRGRSLYTFAYNYTYWDNMVAYVQEPDSAWAQQNLDESLNTYDASAVWVFDPGFYPLYFTASPGLSGLRDLDVLYESYRDIFEHNSFAHFFVQTDSGLVEIRGATIHTSTDNVRNPPIQGYFFAGRLWDDAYLAELGKLVNGQVEIVGRSRAAKMTSNVLEDKGAVSWTHDLMGWKGHGVASLSVRIHSPEIQQQIRTTNLVHILSALLTFSLLGVVAWILARWVALPLRRISSSLAAESVHPIHCLLKETTELGNIARLIHRFLEQKVELVEEIDQRQKAEHALRFMKFSVDHASIAAFWIRADGSFAYVNEAACTSMGYSEEELLKLSVFDLDPNFSREGWAPHWEEIKTRGSFTLESQHRPKNGKPFPVELTINYLEFRGEEYQCTFAQDISERKQAERERERVILETQLRRAQRLETIGTLAGGVAHDFNNILTPILGYADMTMNRLDARNPMRSDIEQISKAAIRARDLVRQILAFSRQGEQERRLIQLHIVFEEALKLIRASVPATIEIRESLKRNCGTVLCDPSQMHQVLMNLCTNAFHAMEENGGILNVVLDSVDLDAEFSSLHLNLNEGRYLRLSVSDTGCGMDGATIERIFEPFYTTKPAGKGTGLGLSVAHGIVMAHGGSITVNSELGRGTTFLVYLPSAVEESEDGVASRAEIPGGTERILLVDDERDICAMAQEMLERLGYSVTSTTKSQEALDIFRARPEQFDLLITDQTMPHMTGDRLAAEILKVRPGTPIVMITGFSERITDKNYRRYGIREFVMKPLLARDLSAAIRRALDTTLHKAETAIT